MSSIVLKKTEDERETIKNIVNFFHESVYDFKKVLNEMSESIGNFLKSLKIIEEQLEIQGYTFQDQENSSDLLFERLTQNKTERESQQKELILKLTKKVDFLKNEESQTSQEIIQPVESLSFPPKLEDVVETEDLKLQPKDDRVELITKLRSPPPKAQDKSQSKPTSIPIITQTPESSVQKDRILKSPDEFSKDSVITDTLRREMLKRIKQLKKIMKNQ
ncbi:MAG: hypothetical protein ACTSRG_06885 [Candidatus Helarchaeota archaeon]